MKYIQLVIFIICAVIPSNACSIFSLETDGNYYLAGNEDYLPNSNSIKFIPEKGFSNGYAVMSVTGAIEQYPQIAINDKGLSVDWATVPESRFIKDKNLKTLRKPLIHELMKSCNTVNDVIAYIKKYNIPHFAKEHMFVADKDGNSIVIEWDNKEVKVIPKEDNYQLITNYKILNPQDGWYPCERFSSGKRILEKGIKDESDTAFIVKVLDSMHQKGAYPTLYSYIFNLKNREIILYSNHNYKKGITYNLDEELTKGAHTILIN